MTQFNVLLWDFNRKSPGPYDILPYFRNKYQETEKKERPVTKEQWKNFITRWGKYMFWARCEYEIVILRWPPTEESYKIDAWEQIENNLDLITEILTEEYEGNS